MFAKERRGVFAKKRGGVFAKRSGPVHLHQAFPQKTLKAGNLRAVSAPTDLPQDGAHPDSQQHRRKHQYSRQRKRFRTSGQDRGKSRSIEGNHGPLPGASDDGPIGASPPPDRLQKRQLEGLHLPHRHRMNFAHRILSIITLFLLSTIILFLLSTITLFLLSIITLFMLSKCQFRTLSWTLSY